MRFHMFGLEDNKKKKNTAEFIYDIEIELKDISKRKAYMEKVQARIQKLKEILNAGVEQDELNHLAVLLHGYSSLFKVLSRKPKPKFK